MIIEDFADQLREVGAHVPTIDDTTGIERVRKIRRRRRRRSVALSVAAGIGAVTAFAAGVVLVGGESTDDVIVTATPPPATVTVSTTPTPPPPAEVATPTTTPAAPITAFDIEPVDVTEFVPGRPLDLPENFPVDGVTADWEWLVPWDGGFLVGSVEQPQPAGVELQGDEAFELLGPEMVEVLNEQEVFGSDEAPSALRAAGFGDELDALLAEHPDVLTAFYGHEWPHQLRGHFSLDGEAWSSLIVELPAEMSMPQTVRSDGDRLVVLAGQRHHRWPNSDPLQQKLVSFGFDLLGFGPLGFDPLLFGLMASMFITVASCWPMTCEDDGGNSPSAKGPSAKGPAWVNVPSRLCPNGVESTRVPPI